MNENTNDDMISGENIISQESKNAHGLRAEKYDWIEERVENLESSLKCVIRKVDQLEKKF